MQKGTLKGLTYRNSRLYYYYQICHLQCKKFMRWETLITHCSLQSWLVTLYYRDFSNSMVKSRNSCTGLGSCWKTDISLARAKYSLRITICQTLSKWRCSYFPTSSKCCSGEITNKIPKALLPNGPKEQLWLSTYCLVQNAHFIAEVIEQVPK